MWSTESNWKYFSQQPPFYNSCSWSWLCNCWFWFQLQNYCWGERGCNHRNKKRTPGREDLLLSSSWTFHKRNKTTPQTSFQVTLRFQNNSKSWRARWTAKGWVQNNIWWHNTGNGNLVLSGHLDSKNEKFNWWREWGIQTVASTWRRRGIVRKIWPIK